MSSVTIDGVIYSPTKTGDRAVVVLDRGWVFVGDLDKSADGTCTLRNCKNIRSWESVGFGGMTKDPKQAKAKMDASADMEFSERAMIFCVPVAADWDAGF